MALSSSPESRPTARLQLDEQPASIEQLYICPGIPQFGLFQHVVPICDGTPIEFHGTEEQLRFRRATSPSSLPKPLTGPLKAMETHRLIRPCSGCTNQLKQDQLESVGLA